MSTHDCITDPPKVAGSYNVSVRGVMACRPIYWDFDGKEWNKEDWRSYILQLNPNDAWWYD